MRWLMGLVLLLLLSGVAEAGRYALVIGNGAYPAGSALGPLANPENDARDMGALLQQHGFKLVDHEGKNAPVLNGTQKQMNAAGIELVELAKADAAAEIIRPLG